MKMQEYLSTTRAYFREGKRMLRAPVTKPDQWREATEKEPNFAFFVYKPSLDNYWMDFAS